MSELFTDSVIQAYFNQKNILAKHQIESYDDYIDNILPNIFKQYSPINIDLNMDVNISNINNVKIKKFKNPFIDRYIKYRGLFV